MLQGALIGLVVGLVMTIITWQKNKKRGGAVLEALETPNGEATALEALNRSTRSVSLVKLGDVVPQKERMAALAIIGDGSAIIREIDQHEGKDSVLAQVHSIALLGARLRGVPEAASRLDGLATRFEAEGGRLLGKAKSDVRALADLAAAIDGKHMPRPSEVAVRLLSTSASPMVRLVVLEALAQSAEAAGGDATAQREIIRKSTQAFDK
jgi:hypothetical protein